MSKRQWKAAILLLGACLGCQVRAPQPSEAPLFNSAASSRIWVIDAVTEFPSGVDQHVSALVTQDRSGANPMVGAYLSVWQSASPQFRFAVQNAPGQAGGRRNRWPIQMRMAADSTQSAFLWDWSRTSLWFQGTLRSPQQPLAAQTWFLKGSYPLQQEFKPVEICNHPSILGITPWQGLTKSPDFQGRGITRWRIGIFDQADALFGARPGECAVWLSVGFSDGRSMQAFLQVDAQRQAKLLGRQLWAGRVPLAANGTYAPIQLPDSAIWKSPIAGHQYPLAWMLDADLQPCGTPSADPVFFVRPRMAGQEIPMKRNSFWMGAIEVRAAASDTIVGKGNLFVFAR